MTGEHLTEADWDAIGAARNADPVPDWVIICQRVGKCDSCDKKFQYGHPTSVGNLDPCPHCDSLEWEKWGYNTPAGKLIPKDKIEEWDRNRKESDTP